MKIYFLDSENWQDYGHFKMPCFLYTGLCEKLTDSEWTNSKGTQKKPWFPVAGDISTLTWSGVKAVPQE